MTKKVEEKVESALPKVRPASDILERADGFHIFMDMPGTAKEDLIIDLNENELTVSAKSSVQPWDKVKTVHQEFGEVEYVRNFTISDALDRNKVSAKLNNGVLELFLPKAEKAKPKRIEIKSA